MSPLLGNEKSRTNAVRLGEYSVLPTFVVLALAYPGIQQLEDGLLDFFGRVGTGEVFAQLFAGEDNIIFSRAFSAPS